MMKHEGLCGWLGLSPEHWPPDHYTLLGLQPGESDLTRIEQAVHERMARLRCYQCSNPELVTEGMNRLAQAFLCLTDPRAKAAYDTGVLSLVGAASPTPLVATKKDTGLRKRPVAAVADTQPMIPPPVRTAVLPAALMDTAISGPKTQVEWKANVPPPPVRAAAAPPVGETTVVPVSEAIPPLPPAVESEPSTSVTRVQQPAVADPPSSVSSSGPLAKYKGFSPSLLRLLSCRHGLGTKRALYRRIRKTRRLLHAWERAGKFLRKPKRQLKNETEAKELGKALAAIGEHLKGLPRFLGRPGQPGYRIAARARLAYSVDWLNSLDDEQRELLAQDWAAGQTLLSSHRQFLRKEARSIRNLSGWRLVARVIACDLPLEMALLTVVLVVLIIVLVLGSR
jgi:hypothetical protein